jgi:hypothetical protein
MQNSSTRKASKGLLLPLFLLGLVTSLILVPTQFQTEAVSKKGDGLFTRTVSADASLPNYDIRGAKSAEAAEAVAGYRASAGKDASFVAQTQQDFVSGEESLRTSVPTLKVEYNPTMNTPEVIAPDIWQGLASLTGPASGVKKAEILRSFIRQNNSLIGVSDHQADQLKVTADYTNPRRKPLVRPPRTTREQHSGFRR